VKCHARRKAELSRGVVEVARPTKQRRQHFLQAGDEVIGLAGALGQVFDLVVFDRHPGLEKLNFAILLPQPFFELFDKLCRDRSGLVVACRTSSI
jgi:hypothetical protein